MTSIFQAAAATRIADKHHKNIFCIQDAARSGDVALVRDYLTVDASLVNDRDGRYHSAVQFLHHVCFKT